MFICFAEYRIAAEWRETYLNYTSELLAGVQDVQLYEGTDQPGLFVEVWNASSLEQAEQLKEERCNERSSWFKVSEWIVGGAAKMHIWTFKPAHLNVQTAISD
ncbi:hypothetical protein BK133_19115 [Paenibacillus sp. FSL H8-0548]|uniref:hypothetical protein n=1 Tax=Paenibacillus sp. FSL H8-0548 TaxID=1920422 RepID=UPI00096CACD8|nr:hypothetical protein [Paenibacillus sp. FSL H8-0548]OMF28123.1 hypothetical protein BK133_19115 [Paenibacillus sp. FSL H8-0548]